MNISYNMLIDNSSKLPSYIQLYNHFKREIASGRLAAGSKLPSLRALASGAGVSTTTTQLAYDQLAVEGYIYSRPQSGYYVSETGHLSEAATHRGEEDHGLTPYIAKRSPYISDSSAFDFNKWKKCANKVFCDLSEMLLFESDPQGEAALRYEIAQYLRLSRGVIADHENIVIGAGTQQITGHLARILKRLDIQHISLESPGYLPVQRIFGDAGFVLSHVPVMDDGIRLELLPQNIPSAVYVSPSNHFPTGAVMPIGRRNRLLQWAEANGSIVIEDDYDSELRYFGKPIPAMQGLSKSGSVVYLGSFSSTLFPAAKISYMVLPSKLMDIFRQLMASYSQTCSKAEQLTLALFMEQGFYATGLRRLRSLNSQKLQQALASIKACGGSKILARNTNSGLNIVLSVESDLSAEALCQKGRAVGLLLSPLSSLSSTDGAATSSHRASWENASQKEGKRKNLIFYYSKPPLSEIDRLIRELAILWFGA